MCHWHSTESLFFQLVASYKLIVRQFIVPASTAFTETVSLVMGSKRTDDTSIEVCRPFRRLKVCQRNYFYSSPCYQRVLRRNCLLTLADEVWQRVFLDPEIATFSL